jgi:hypothetical protein
LLITILQVSVKLEFYATQSHRYHDYFVQLQAIVVHFFMQQKMHPWSRIQVVHHRSEIEVNDKDSSLHWSKICDQL